MNSDNVGSPHLHRVAGCSLSAQEGSDSDVPLPLTTTMMAAYTAMRGGAHGVCLAGPEDAGPLIQDLTSQEMARFRGHRGYV